MFYKTYYFFIFYVKLFVLYVYENSRIFFISITNHKNILCFIKLIIFLFFMLNYLYYIFSL